MKARLLLSLTLALGMVALTARAGDWPQWLGPNRNARATGFKAPAAWPKELTKKWTVTVGNGVATPALVGDKLFVFSREGDSKGGVEVLRCLDANSGKEVWAEKYEVAFKASADAGFPGPRSSPAVAEGKVVALGVNGTLSCHDAQTGKQDWRVETGSFPRFHTSSSPLVADGLVVMQFGGEKGGGVTAYTLAGGKEKWKWADEGTAYASPILMTVGDTKVIIAETSGSVIALGLTDGKLYWKTPFAVTGRGYNSSTPVASGQTVVFSGSGRGTRAFTLEKSGDTITAKEKWNNPDHSVIYNTPVVREKLVFGLTSGNSLFCIDAESGKTAWTSETKGRQGYGSIVDAGPVLVALTPTARLVVYEPSEKEFKELANYKVADSDTYAYPVLDGNRLFIKDRDSVTLWTVD